MTVRNRLGYAAAVALSLGVMGGCLALAALLAHAIADWVMSESGSVALSLIVTLALCGALAGAVIGAVKAEEIDRECPPPADKAPR